MVKQLHDYLIHLTQKKLIPEIRIRVFADDDYSPGRGPSPRSNFIKNGHSDDSMKEHPHFLKYLKYFIYGPCLPSAVIKEIQNKLNDLGDIDAYDHDNLKRFIRKVARDRILKKSDSEKIFCLILEITDDLYLARKLRKEVMIASR